MVNTLLLIFSVASISLVAIIGISCGAVLVFFIIRFVLRVLLAGRGKPTSEKTIYERRYFPFCSIEIEDGRLYEILSSSSSEIRIACAERYKAEEKSRVSMEYRAGRLSATGRLHLQDDEKEKTMVEVKKSGRRS